MVAPQETPEGDLVSVVAKRRTAAFESAGSAGPTVVRDPAVALHPTVVRDPTAASDPVVVTVSAVGSGPVGRRKRSDDGNPS